MAREKLIFDPRSTSGTAKRLLSSEKPDEFRPAFGKAGQKIIGILASGPSYPAEIARVLARALNIPRNEVVLKLGGASVHKLYSLPLGAATALERIAGDA